MYPALIVTPSSMLRCSIGLIRAQYTPDGPLQDGVIDAQRSSPGRSARWCSYEAPRAKLHLPDGQGRRRRAHRRRQAGGERPAEGRQGPEKTAHSTLQRGPFAA